MIFLFWPQILLPKMFKVCWGWVSQATVLLCVLSFTFHFHSCGISAQKEKTFGLNTKPEFSLVGFESPTDTSEALSSQMLPLISFVLFSLACCGFVCLGCSLCLPCLTLHLSFLQGTGSYRKQQRKCVSEKGSGGLNSGKCHRIVHCSDRNPALSTGNLESGLWKSCVQ